MKLSSTTKIGLAILFFLVVMGFNWAYFGKTLEGASNKGTMATSTIFIILLLCIILALMCVSLYGMYLVWKGNQSETMVSN